MGMPELIEAFVSHLEGLARRQERGAIAKLRRGAGRGAGGAVEALPFIVPFLPADDGAAEAFFLVGALFGMYPEPGGIGNFGDTFRRLGDHESAQKRFVALLDAHRDDVGEHLRHAVSLARSRDVPIDFRRLLRDLTFWNHPERFVQLAWARSYWGRAADADADADDTREPSSAANPAEKES